MISIVIPIFNESAGVERLYNRLVASASSWAEDCEFILADDGSRDNTLDLSGCVSYTQYKENSRLSRRLEKGLGKQFGHRPDVICHPRSHHRRLIAIFFPRALDPLA